MLFIHAINWFAAAPASQSETFEVQSTGNFQPGQCVLWDPAYKFVTVEEEAMEAFNPAFADYSQVDH